MTSAPPPPSGWKQAPIVPTSQQQAQDTVVGYLKKTLQQLPAGTLLDGSRYSGGTNTVPCNDDPDGTPPLSFTTIGDLKIPAGTDTAGIVAKAGP